MHSSLSVAMEVNGWKFSGGGYSLIKDLMGTCGQPGYVFRDFCLKQGIGFINFFLDRSP